MVYCAVVGCKSGGPSARSVPTHKWPKSKAMQEKWESQLNRRFTPTANTRVCSKHFCPSDYIQLKNVKRLKPTAFPTKLLRGAEQHDDHIYAAPDVANDQPEDHENAMDISAQQQDQEMSMGEVEIDLPLEEKYRLLQEKVKQLEEEKNEEIRLLKEENNSLKEDVSAVQKVFASDQLYKLKNPNTRKPWTTKTMQQSVRLVHACGSRGYDLVREELGNFFPKIRYMLLNAEC